MRTSRSSSASIKELRLSWTRSGPRPRTAIRRSESGRSTDAAIGARAHGVQSGMARRVRARPPPAAAGVSWRLTLGGARHWAKVQGGVRLMQHAAKVRPVDAGWRALFDKGANL